MDEIYVEIEQVKTVAIIGGGSASFLAADQLSKHFEVSIYEKGKSLGKKFLVAGKGGFNLAHNFEYQKLTSMYSPSGFMDDSLASFGVNQLRDWYAEMGISTFVGSSNRIFPDKIFSPGDVLNAIKTKLINKGVQFKLSHEFIGFSSTERPILKSGSDEVEIEADYYIFALGGGSWKVTGANNNWLTHFDKIGIETTPFESSNCGLNIDWPTHILDYHIGKPLKNISISVNNHHVKGEAVISNYGIEGNAVYPISASIRALLKTQETPQINIDFKPKNDIQQLQYKLRNTTPKNYGKSLNLDSVKMALLKNYCTKEEYLAPELFLKKVKSLPITIQSLRPVEESISTVGGISIHSLNPNFSLKTNPNIFCIGEMVNWDAPTGGFLLQGCFSMSNFIAQNILSTKKTD